MRWASFAPQRKWLWSNSGYVAASRPAPLLHAFLAPLLVIRISRACRGPVAGLSRACRGLVARRLVARRTALLQTLCRTKTPGASYIPWTFDSHVVTCRMLCLAERIALYAWRSSGRVRLRGPNPSMLDPEQPSLLPLDSIP